MYGVLRNTHQGQKTRKSARGGYVFDLTRGKNTAKVPVVGVGGKTCLRTEVPPVCAQKHNFYVIFPYIRGMYLPYDQNIDAKVLAQIYKNTTATYKFYWFASILDILVKEGKTSMSFWEIIIGMIAEAWYPVHYFRISFGKSDSLSGQIIQLQQALHLPIDSDKELLKRDLAKNLNRPEIKSLLNVFTINVPYRFLSPWINHITNYQVEALSQTFYNNCMYAIKGEQIHVNPLWVPYLRDNYVILKEFTFWNLTLFLQKRNPNVPDLSSKLVKPIQRDSLLKQRRYWDNFIEVNGPVRCIYTGRPLEKNLYAIDHFIPWSFVSHNLLWNLLPVDPGVNSAKSNDLPRLDIFLKPFAQVHNKVLKTAYYNNPNNKLLEDYLVLYDSVSELVKLSQDDFYRLYKKTFSPLVQIAENMGFKYWKTYNDRHENR